MLSSNEKPKEKLKSATVYRQSEMWPNFRRKLEQLDVVRATEDRSDTCVGVSLCVCRRMHKCTKTCKLCAYCMRTVNNKKSLLEELIT